MRQVWFVGGVVPMAAGGMGPYCLHCIMFFALLSFARASRVARASNRAAGCPWGVPWGRGARVEVRRVWSVGGVVPMAAGGMGPSCLHSTMFFCSGAFCYRASGGARASDRAAGCSWGVPWGGCVVLRRRHRRLMKTWTRRKWTLCALRGPEFPPLECSSAAEVQSFI
jgi:hypothetical protein